MRCSQHGTTNAEHPAAFMLLLNLHEDLNLSSLCSYLDGVAEAGDIVNDGRGHEADDQGLKLATQLSLQVTDQVLAWRYSVCVH